MTVGLELNPVAAIGSAVQERAKHEDLDVTTPEGQSALRRFIADEVQQWRVEHRRGRRAVDLPDPDTASERVFRDLARYGPLTDLLDDPDVWEIMVNAPDAIFVRRHQGPSGYHHEVFHDDEHVVRTVTRVLESAGTSHRKFDPAEGLQDAQLDDGSRVHLVHGELSRGGHVLLNIRRFTAVPYRSLDELVAGGTVDVAAAAFLSECVRAGLSIVVAGPPGAGKTTLLSCCCAELAPTLRVVVAEEVFEADVPLANVAQMQTRPQRSDRPAIDLRRLVAGFLRMAPDVAIVGEVRDREALPLLLTLSSGVQGFTTIHAGSTRQALTRLRFVCQLADTDLPMSALNTLVSEAVDIVVHCTRTESGPKVREILAVEDLASGADATHFTTTSVFDRRSADHPLRWTGQIPSRAAAAFADRGVDLLALLGPRAPVGPTSGQAF